MPKTITRLKLATEMCHITFTYFPVIPISVDWYHTLGEMGVDPCPTGGEHQYKLFATNNMRMTDQRRVIAKILDNADDHPDVEELHKRACVIDKNISVATVYRTVRLFEEAGILVRHEFKDGRSRYENVDTSDHHDHLIDIENGEIIEWIGWAILTWSLSGFVFAIWTIANLVPRAFTHHKWYQENFSDYPKNRKAIIPGII